MGARTARGGRLGNEAAGGPTEPLEARRVPPLDGLLSGVYCGLSEGLQTRETTGSRVSKTARHDSFFECGFYALEVQESCRVARGLRCTRRWLKFKTNKIASSFQNQMTSALTPTKTGAVLRLCVFSRRSS